MSLDWITEDRIAKARRAWSKAYGRVVTRDEAIEILMNVRRLAELIFAAESERSDG
jgi:hypothetical protein